MCFVAVPAIWGAIAAISSAAGAGVAIAGAVVAENERAAGEQKNAEIAERIAKRNAEVAEVAAIGAERRGGIEAGKALSQGTRVVGQQRAAYAQGGVDVGSGTALQMVNETQLTAALDAQAIRNSAAQEAFGYRTQAKDIVEQARLEREARVDRTAGTILTGIGYGLEGVGSLAKLGSSVFGGPSASGARSLPPESLSSLRPRIKS